MCMGGGGGGVDVLPDYRTACGHNVSARVCMEGGGGGDVFAYTYTAAVPECVCGGGGGRTCGHNGTGRRGIEGVCVGGSPTNGHSVSARVCMGVTYLRVRTQRQCQSVWGGGGGG